MSDKEKIDEQEDLNNDEPGESVPVSSEKDTPAEVGGRKGPEPTRFGDWEKNGRCIDF